MNSVVERFQQFRMDGNIVPHTWYQSPRLAQKNGKPNLVAITLLADVVYWYRPAEVRDETSGAHLGFRQKFAADKLQKNYRKWGDGFGFTLRQVEDAVAFLKAAGVVTVERRNVVTELGTFPNCAFIEPLFEAIKEITYPEDGKGDRRTSPVKTGDPSRSGGRTSPVPARSPSRPKGRNGTLQGENSKSPSENSKETSSGEAPSGAPEVLASPSSEPDRNEPVAAAPHWGSLSDDERATWLDKAEAELREGFGASLWTKTKERSRAPLRESRAVSLYRASFGAKGDSDAGTL